MADLGLIHHFSINFPPLQGVWYSKKQKVPKMPENKYILGYKYRIIKS